MAGLEHYWIMGDSTQCMAKQNSDELCCRVSIGQCWKPELESFWSFGMTALVKDYWYCKTSESLQTPGLLAGICSATGHAPLGEVEQGEFDCTYLTPPPGWVLGHREVLRHSSGSGKTQS
jgi:hypothetical protein